VFATKRGDLKESEIYCNPLYPFYVNLIEQYKASPLCRGIMKDYIQVNPQTDCSELDDSSIVSFVPMANVQEKNNRVEYDAVPYESVKKGFTVFRKGDLIWAKITPCIQNGKSCVVDDMPTEIGFGSTEFHVIRKRSDDIYMPYIWAIFSNDNVLKAAQATFSGSAGQQRVSASFLERFPALLPDFDTQVRMVRNLEVKLTALNAKLQQADKMLLHLKNIVPNYMKVSVPEDDGKIIYAVTKGNIKNRLDANYYRPYYIRLQAELKRVFGKNLTTIGAISDVICGPFGSAIKNTDYCEYGVPLLRIINITKWGTLDYSDLKYISKDLAESLQSTQVSHGDLVISQRGTLGQCAIVDDTFEKYSISANLIAIKNIKGLSSEFVRNYIMSSIGITLLQRSQSGQVQSKITTDDIKNIPIPTNVDEGEINKAIRIILCEYQELKQQAEQELAAAREQFEKELLGGEKQ
jgi:type I restriction enzyme S subunit